MGTQRGLIVADDLSGANDTGHQLAARGYPTTVVTGRERTPTEESVVVVNTDSRYLDAHEAADRVADAAGGYDGGFVYKKIDSTLRGNLVAEIDAVVEATGSDLALVAPAFPEMGRITVQGTHLVHGTPVARTAAGRDPDKPVRDSHVPTLLEDESFDVVHLPIEVVADGTASIAERLRATTDISGASVVVCDAATPKHLDSIAAGAAAVERDVAYVGSGGLARHVRIDATAASGVLGIVGSASARTFEQVSALAAEHIVRVDGPRAIEDPEAVVDDVSDRAVDALTTRSRAVLTAARGEDDIEATLAAGNEAGLSDSEIRDRIATILGQCARAVHRKRGFGGVFVTGGAVATTVLDALDGTGIELTGHAVGEGIPLGRIDGGLADGVPLVTKAGAFGESDTILKSLDYLAQYDDGQ